MAQLKEIDNVKESKRLFGLDHLRTLAIVLVFVFHYGRLFQHPEWTNTISQFGWSGVDLFFVLSGYLISSQLFSNIAEHNAIPLRSFFIKRFFRIIPAYLFVVAIYFLFPFCREREELAPLWKYLTFTQNLGLDLRTQGTFSHAWSLCIEEQFYLFLPLILATLVYFKVFKKSYIIIVLLFAFGFFTRAYLWYKAVLPFKDQNDAWAYWYKWIYYPTFCRLDSLLSGVLIAAIFQFYPTIKTKLLPYGNQLLGLSIAVLAVAYFVCTDQETLLASIVGFSIVSVAYGLMVLSAICSTSILYKFNSRITATIASLSYSIYLIHKITIHLTQEYFTCFSVEKDSNIMFLICIITTLISAFIMNRIIEKPFLHLRDKLLQNKLTGFSNTINDKL